jgi:hypothetical protein
MEEFIAPEYIIEVKKRGRPKKYNTEEEAKEAQLEQMKIFYEKKNGHPPGTVKRGPKPVRTLEEIREKERQRNKRYYYNKKNKKNAE